MGGKVAPIGAPCHCGAPFPMPLLIMPGPSGAPMDGYADPDKVWGIPLPMPFDQSFCILPCCDGRNAGAGMVTTGAWLAKAKGGNVATGDWDIIGAE